jgi:hypothetical protein
MRLQDFRDAHAGENILCIGTGTSLLDIPVDFLRSMTSIGINYLTHYNDLIDGFMPTYWVALDSGPMVMLNTMPSEVIRFVPNRQERRIKADQRNLTNIVLFEIAAMPRPDKAGYSTSMAAAVQLALYMGASNALVVGFDCTKGNKSDALPELGKTGTPHFYDPDRGRQYQPGWDKNIGQFAEWAESMGKNVWNLSPFTMSTMVPRSDYREWWNGSNPD